MTQVALACTHHDPDQRLYAQTALLMPWLGKHYAGIVLYVTAATHPASVELLREQGAQLIIDQPEASSGFGRVGYARRKAVARALEYDCTHIHLCDFDRVLHWAEQHSDELIQVLECLSDYDFTVLGRSERAFATHPRVQRDTERIINHVFAKVSGWEWDVTAASRGLSRRAAEMVTTRSGDETIGNDCSWPLLLHQAGVTLGYVATEGLEFETPDRYGDEIAACGGLDAWIERIDADPQAWATRLELARIEVEAMVQEMKKEGRKTKT